MACVCLLPGAHKWAGSEIDYLHHLDLHGCGAVLELAAPFRVVKAESVELSNLDLVGADGVSDELLRFLGCSQVTCAALSVRTESVKLPPA